MDVKVGAAWRQGDVVLQIVSMGYTKASEKNDVRPKTLKKGRQAIVALGEATGHSHRVESEGDDIEQWSTWSEERLSVPESGALFVHEEHGAHALPGATYRVHHQVEFSPGGNRAVRD